jgi:hypothetical protein
MWIIDLTLMLGFLLTLWGILSLIFPDFMINARGYDYSPGMKVDEFLETSKGKAFFRTLSWFSLITGLVLLIITSGLSLY